MSTLQRRVDRKQWDGAPGDVSAMYAPSLNHMLIITGLAQEPYFSVKYHPARNFGAMGSTISHELIHEGHKFDSNGKKRDYWTAQESQEFQKRAQCMRDQFVVMSNNGTELSNVNGSLTVADKIAGNAGLKFAFLGLQDLLRRNPKGWRHKG